MILEPADIKAVLEESIASFYSEFVSHGITPNVELSEACVIRPMMGEYIIYYRGKIVGGIYDDRLLVKPTKSAVSCMKTVTYELPYDGVKEMLLVDEVDSKEFLTGLLESMYPELPMPKPKPKSQKTK